MPVWPESRRLRGHTRLRRFQLFLMIMLLPLASCATVPASPKSDNSHEPGWVLTWSDEFNNSAALSKWKFETGGNGWSLKQLQWYDSSNARVDEDGHLVITADKGSKGHHCWYGPCLYSSVRMMTKGLFSQTYGLFEARIKLPQGRGLWPAFWLEGANVSKVGWPACGEIDIIEELSQTPDIASGYSHAPGRNHQASVTLAKPLSTEYHTYGIEWTPKGITWLIDGFAYSHISHYPGWPFNHPFYLLLDLAVGGKAAGRPTAATRFPAQLDVDWVRVYRQAS